MSTVTKLRPVFADRLDVMAFFIVLIFASVFLLSSQSAASYPSYLFTLFLLLHIKKWADVFRVSLLRWILALLVWMSVSVFWSEDSISREVLSVFGRALLVFCFVVGFAECQVRGHLQRWLGNGLALVGALAIFAAIWKFHDTNPADGRLNGLGQLDTHVLAALVFGVVMIFMLDVITRAQNRVYQGLVLVAFLAGAYAVVMSDSRNAIVSVFLGIAVFIAARVANNKYEFLAAFSAVSVIGVATLAVFMSNPELRDLLLPRGLSFRLDIWSETLSQIYRRSVIWGAGIATEDQITIGKLVFRHPHNMFLSIVQQSGLIGLMVYIVILYKCLLRLLENIQTKDAQLAIAVLVVGLSAHLLDGHGLIDKIGSTWFLIWLPLAVGVGLEWRSSQRPDTLKIE